jgi:hypothetical protein
MVIALASSLFWILLAHALKRTLFIAFKTVANMSNFDESKPSIKNPQARVTSRNTFGKHKTGSSKSNKMQPLAGKG